MTQMSKKVIVVGGGLSGLSAAIELERQGVNVTIVESSSRIGGRLKTDHYKGFKLDHGFQVLLTSYREVKRLGLKTDLDLKKFQSGAALRFEKLWLSIYNPVAHPLRFFKTLKCLPIKFLIDFFRLAKPLFSPFNSKGSTLDYINKIKLSFYFKNYFIKPFFAGVFLETELKTRALFFQKYLRCFFMGKAALPIGGMEQIPKELLRRLSRTQVLLNSSVVSVGKGEVCLSNGDTLRAEAVILALSNPALNKLDKRIKLVKSLPVTCLYYTVPKGSLDVEGILYLGFNSAINNVCFPSIVQPSYAPAGYDLISVSVVDLKWQNNPRLVGQVENELCNWFGLDLKKLKLLKSYSIKHALPTQYKLPAKYLEFENKEPNIFYAGESTGYASIDGALLSGKVAAQRTLKQLSEEKNNL